MAKVTVAVSWKRWTKTDEIWRKVRSEVKYTTPRKLILIMYLLVVRCINYVAFYSIVTINNEFDSLFSFVIDKMLVQWQIENALLILFEIFDTKVKFCWTNECILVGNNVTMQTIWSKKCYVCRCNWIASKILLPSFCTVYGWLQPPPCPWNDCAAMFIVLRIK